MNRDTLRRTNLYREARSRIQLFVEAASSSDRITFIKFSSGEERHSSLL